MHAMRSAWKWCLLRSFRAGMYSVAAVVLLGSVSSAVMALGCSPQISSLDCQAVINNWVNWVPDPVCQTATGDTTTLTGADQEEQTFNYFRSHGLSAIAAAAVVGNLMRESHLDPTIAQTGGDTKDPSQFTHKLEGWGIAQWDPGAKIIGIAKSLNVSGPIYELSTQLDIVWNEMTGTAPTGAQNVRAGLEQKTSLPSLKNSRPFPDDTNLGDPTTATGYFQNLFEGGNDYGARVNLANAAFSKYGKNTVPGATGLSDTSTGGNTTTTTDGCTPAGGITGSCTNSSPGNTYDKVKSNLTKYKINLIGDHTLPWAIETYNTACTLASAPTYYSKLTSQGTITVDLHSNGYGCGSGHATLTQVDLYGFCDKNYNRYILSHELGHVYSFRNPKTYTDFVNNVFSKQPKLPTWDCTIHAFNGAGAPVSSGPFAGDQANECFAAMVGEYLIYFNLRETVGGNPPGEVKFPDYPTKYSAYYNFAKGIFGGVEYKSF